MKTIARGLLLSLLMNGVAWAQTGDKVPGCTRPAYYSVLYWNQMSAESQKTACWYEAERETLRVAPVVKPKSTPKTPKQVRQTPEQVRQRAKEQAQGWREASPRLKYFGWGTVFVGIMWMIPAGTTYDVFGEDVCVQKYSISEGACSVPRWQLKAAAGMIAGGFVLAKIGGRHVAVNPTVSKSVQGVSANVVW